MSRRRYQFRPTGLTTLTTVSSEAPQAVTHSTPITPPEKSAPNATSRNAAPAQRPKVSNSSTVSQSNKVRSSALRIEEDSSFARQPSSAVHSRPEGRAPRAAAPATTPQPPTHMVTPTLHSRSASPPSMNTETNLVTISSRSRIPAGR
jgi:hypothetical protein